MTASRQTQSSWKAACYAGAAIAILLGLPALALGARQPYVISISTLHDTFKSGAEITVQVTLKNTSDKDVFVSGKCSPKGDVDSFRVEVKDAQGKAAPETNFLRWLRGDPVPRPGGPGAVWGGPSCAVVAPGQFINSGFVLNAFYDLSKPGKYRIQVQRTDPTSKATVKSNTIEVTVTP